MIKLDTFLNARCVGSPLPFTEASDDPDAVRAALRLCDGCPSTPACLEWAQAQPCFDGVAGAQVWRNGRISGVPAQPRPVLVDEVSLRRHHAAFTRGQRDPDTVAGEKAYQAAKYQALKARARAAAATPAAGDPGRCADCARPMRPSGTAPDGRVRHTGRGLCEACHRRHGTRGTLPDFGRRNRSSDELLTEYDLLASEGYPRPVIAQRLGITEAALVRALQRAHRRTAHQPRRTP